MCQNGETKDRISFPVIVPNRFVYEALGDLIWVIGRNSSRSKLDGFQVVLSIWTHWEKGYIEIHTKAIDTKYEIH